MRVVHQVRVGWWCFGLHVPRRERVANVVGVVAEVENERRVLLGMCAVQSRQGLHCSEPRQGLVDVHRVELGLIEAGLILLGNDKDLEFAGVELCRSL